MYLVSTIILRVDVGNLANRDQADEFKTVRILKSMTLAIDDFLKTEQAKIRGLRNRPEVTFTGLWIYLSRGRLNHSTYIKHTLCL
jgi:hypothetical protein